MDPDIALFAEVVEAGSLSAAARARGISPAMVSKRIARLEARLGTRLLNRTTRRLEPTARGERFHQEVVAILAALRGAEARVAHGEAEAAGPLRVSAPTSFGRLHLAPIIKPFLDRHPRIALELYLSDGFDDLMAGGIDLAIRITAGKAPGLAMHRLADSRRILCAAPTYIAANGAPATIGALRGHTLLAAAGQSPWRLSGGVIDVDSVVRTNSSEVVRELALAGVGIALRSLWDVSAALGDGRLVRVLPTVQGSADVGIHAVHLPGAPGAAAQALLDYLVACWTPSPPWED